MDELRQLTEYHLSQNTRPDGSLSLGRASPMQGHVFGRLVASWSKLLWWDDDDHDHDHDDDDATAAAGRRHSLSRRERLLAAEMAEQCLRELIEEEDARRARADDVDGVNDDSEEDDDECGGGGEVVDDDRDDLAGPVLPRHTGVAKRGREVRPRRSGTCVTPRLSWTLMERRSSSSSFARRCGGDARGATPRSSTGGAGSDLDGAEVRAQGRGRSSTDDGE